MRGDGGAGTYDVGDLDKVKSLLQVQSNDSQWKEETERCESPPQPQQGPRCERVTTGPIQWQQANPLIVAPASYMDAVLIWPFCFVLFFFFP